MLDVLLLVLAVLFVVLAVVHVVSLIVGFGIALAAVIVLVAVRGGVGGRWIR